MMDTERIRMVQCIHGGGGASQAKLRLFVAVLDRVDQSSPTVYMCGRVVCGQSTLLVHNLTQLCYG